MEKDKTFNLQLTIHKLEEELALYRNGTTAEEMFDLIKEKETEIDELRSALHSKDNTLRQISKSSADVLSKYDAIVLENKQLSNDMRAMTDQLTAANNRTNDVTAQYNLTLQESSEKMKILSSNSAELTEINTHLKKCLGNKDATINELKESVMRYEGQLEAMKLNEGQVVALKKTVADRDHSVQRLKESLADSDVSIEKLQKRCADLVSEKAEKFRQLDQERQDMISHVQKFRESMSANITQRDEALRRKEDKIKELNFQITLLGQDNKLKTQKAEEVAAERDAHWRGRITELESRLAESEKGTSSGASSGSAALKADNDALRVRLMDLEDKMHRQDQAMKRRVLQERSANAPLHFDPADIAKPVATLSGAAPQTENMVFRSQTVGSSYSYGAPAGREFSVFTDRK